MGRHHDFRGRQYGPLNITSYCRESDIYFNRPINVPPPQSLIESSVSLDHDKPSTNHCGKLVNNQNLQQANGFQRCISKEDDYCCHKSIDFNHNIEQSCNKLHIEFAQTQSNSSSASLVSKSSSDNNRDNDYVKIRPLATITNNNSAIKQPEIDEDYARERLIAKVDKHIFWSSKAAKNVHIYNIEHKQVYIYTLESYTEKRSIIWQFEPLNHRRDGSTLSKMVAPTFNQAADGELTTSKLVWSSDDLKQHSNHGFISTSSKPASIKLFQSSIESRELPNTSFVKTCHICHGRARKNCNNCNALGYEVCYACLGKGYRNNNWSSSSGTDHQQSAFRSSTHRSGEDDENSYNSTNTNRRVSLDAASSSDMCHQCHGGGRRRCHNCRGAGFNNCQGCEGQTKVRCFQKLIVVLNNHRKEIIINNDNEAIIPDERLKLASGRKIHEQTAPKLKPISLVDSDPGIARVSKLLLEKHQSAFKDELLIQQRHKVSSIEVSIVKYKWKNRFGHFVIYGEDRKAFVPSFPYKNICSIS